MFKYENNKQVKKEFKKIVIDENLTMTEVAVRCGLSSQILNNRFNNTRLALSDLKEWCNAINYDLIIDFVPTGKNSE